MLTPVQKFIFNLRAFFILLLGFILALYVSWMLNASLGYGYSWLYGFYDSKQHIEYYAPQNRYRSGFEFTSEEQHKELFQQIVNSVHSDGEGLKDIYYSFAGNDVSLLHEAEVVHLQDVAQLINSIHRIVLIVMFFFILLLFFQRAGLIQYGNKTDVRMQLIIAVVLAGFVSVLFLTVGAKEIFYQMHVLIFPDDHQWFFYYQDSLMSTLMKAPDLFAGIAVQILVLGIVLFVLGILSYQRIMQRFVKSSVG